MNGPAKTISLIVADPHAVAREGLPPLLDPHGIAVLATAATGDGAEALIAEHAPDVALISLDLVDVDGVVLLRRLLQGGTRSAIVLHTDAEDPEQAAVALHAGAAGAISKRRAVGELAGAVRVVAGGGLWFNESGPAAQPSRPPGAARAEARERRTAALSDSELRVLALVAGGSSTEATAEALSLSPHTVRAHLRNTMRKLDATSRAQAVAIAMRESAIAV